MTQLHGGITTDDREQLRLAFQADPADHPVQILLATDAASEGIDLQAHCHRLVNYDIPFNPNKLEQRIGRIDRYGQQVAPEIRHFVGTGWQTADAYDADLEFLARVARKVARMEEDLGRVNACWPSRYTVACSVRPVTSTSSMRKRQGRLAASTCRLRRI